MAFHNGLNYDCHFIIKELAKGFEETFNVQEEILKNKKSKIIKPDKND